MAKCRDCGHELTKFRVEAQSNLTAFYNVGDLVGRCDNSKCVSYGSTWRLRKAKRQRTHRR